VGFCCCFAVLSWISDTALNGKLLMTQSCGDPGAFGVYPKPWLSTWDTCGQKNSFRSVWKTPPLSTGAPAHTASSERLQGQGCLLSAMYASDCDSQTPPPALRAELWCKGSWSPVSGFGFSS
jgi:hypothetical protein